MSWDFVYDAIDSLEKDGSQYAILVGKGGFKKTDIFFNINTRHDAEKFLECFRRMIDDKFPMEEKPERKAE